MYTEYFKLNEPPFSLTPDPRYLFMSERHREGLAHLLYGVQQSGGFVQLTGDVGSGKTTLCRCLIKQLPPETDVALILNPRLTVLELLAAVCDELGISYPADAGSIKVLIDALNRRLLESHARGRRTVLIIDEAQNLQEDVLEQIRLLTNLETSKEKLLQIILIGQPELLTILKQQKLRQLAQRITARYHLLALTKNETSAYIQHRLLVSGRRDPLFTRRAMHRIYRLSRGVPRIINIICDRALLGAYALDKQRIGTAIVNRASRETRGILPWRRRLHITWMIGIPAAAILVIAAAIFLEPAGLSTLRRKAESLFGRSPQPSAAAAGQSSPIPAQQAYAGDSSNQAAAGGFSDPKPAGFLPESVEAAKAPDANVAQKPAGGDVMAGKTGTSLQLIELLTSASLPAKNESAFAGLYRLYGIQSAENASNIGCEDARSKGFECYFDVGNWLKLRRYNVPAILEIVLPNGRKRQAAIVGLEDEAATLAIGNREYRFSVSEINRVWDGSFIILWKPPFAKRLLSIGDSGKEVEWIRRALDAAEGKTPAATYSERFDQDLKQRVLGFQRRETLIQDGFVGSETLVRLTIAQLGPKAPFITRRTR
ncbi:MAG: AAA family ATPase [Acidobacteria bacterium]|nr:AAA family ATPase [Acidobacteriota bacterium]